MEKRTYSFAAGAILLVVSLAFFIIPAVLDVDAFIPFIFSLVSFVFGIGFFFIGHSEK